jgi:hypothetical protein
MGIIHGNNRYIPLSLYRKMGQMLMLSSPVLCPARFEQTIAAPKRGDLRRPSIATDS